MPTEIHYHTNFANRPQEEYTDLTQAELVATRLKRAYVVAGVLCGVSILLAIIPSTYVLSTVGVRPEWPDKSAWSVCWKCESATSRICCTSMTSEGHMCSTLANKSLGKIACWPNSSKHLIINESTSTAELCSRDRNGNNKVEYRIDKWRPPRGGTAKQSSIRIEIPGVYVIYSKIAFRCKTENHDHATYMHAILVRDGRGNSTGQLAISKRRHEKVAKESNDICYNSVLTAMAELYKTDEVYVGARPCDEIYPHEGLSHFGVFRIA